MNNHMFCTCWQCSTCFVPAAPPWQMVLEQRKNDRWMAQLCKPRFKLHADGKVTPLPSFAAEVLAGITL